MTAVEALAYRTYWGLELQEKGWTRGAGMEAQLKAMKLGALSKRALASGATAEELEAAQDEDEPKAAVIALILRYEVDPSEALRGGLS
eukprot:COSAG06_NODE_22982_length_706_cov_1.243822_2_plen_87_part_01